MLTVDCERLHGGDRRIAQRLLQLTRVVARVVHVRRREVSRKREGAWHAARLEHLKKTEDRAGIWKTIKPPIEERIRHPLRKRLNANVQWCWYDFCSSRWVPEPD